MARNLLYTVGVIVIIILVIHFLFNFSKEGFMTEEINFNPKMAISVAVANYIKPDTVYGNYLQFLKANNNTSYTLPQQPVFNEMRMAAQNAQLTPGLVYSYIMKDYPSYPVSENMAGNYLPTNIETYRNTARYQSTGRR
jgi:hypothetical protein